MAISDLQLAVRLGTLLPVSGSALITSGGMDRRIGIMALLLATALAFVAIIPDLELAPATFRLVQRARALVSFVHLLCPRSPAQAANAGGLPSTVSASGHNCIIEFTCSRLC